MEDTARLCRPLSGRRGFVVLRIGEKDARLRDSPNLTTKKTMAHSGNSAQVTHHQGPRREGVDSLLLYLAAEFQAPPGVDQPLMFPTRKLSVTTCRGVPLLVSAVMLALVARPGAKAFTLCRSLGCSAIRHASFRHEQRFLLSNKRVLFSTMSPTEMEELEAKIRVKGNEIRELKADGIDKEALSPHIQELLSLKAQLPEDGNEKKTPKKKNDKGQGKQKKPGPSKAQEQMSASEIRLNRLSKVTAMREAGMEPFEYTFDTTHTAAHLLSLYDGKLEGGEEDEEADVAVAGRIMTRRVFGKLAFFTLQDETGTIQLQFDKKRLDESFKVGARNLYTEKARVVDAKEGPNLAFFSLEAPERLDGWRGYCWGKRNNSSYRQRGAHSLCQGMDDVDKVGPAPARQVSRLD